MMSVLLATSQYWPNNGIIGIDIVEAKEPKVQCWLPPSDSEDGQEGRGLDLSNVCPLDVGVVVDLITLAHRKGG
jgi:hypothetical protein